MNSLWFLGANLIGGISAMAVLAAAAVPALRARIFSKDYLAGLLFQAFGVGTLWVGATLALGTAVRMGPGFVPRMLGFILVGIGAVISLQAALAPSERPDRGYWRPFLLISATVLAFAFVYDFAGLVPAIVATVLVAAAGGHDQNWTQTAISIVILSVLCVGVFYKALGLPMRVFFDVRF